MSTDMDIVEELNATSYALPQDNDAWKWRDPPVNVCTRAADTISSLRQEVEILKAERDDAWENRDDIKQDAAATILSMHADIAKLSQEVETLREALGDVRSELRQLCYETDGVLIGSSGAPEMIARIDRALLPKDKP